MEFCRSPEKGLMSGKNARKFNYNGKHRFAFCKCGAGLERYPPLFKKQLQPSAELPKFS